MKKRKGRFLIRSGLLLIAAAFALGAYNLYDSFRAGVASQESVAFLETVIVPAERQQTVMQVVQSGSVQTQTAQTQTAQSDVLQHGTTLNEAAPSEAQLGEMPIVSDVRKEVEIPDYVLNPNMPMPVNRHNGQDYIGILEIPSIDLKIPVISEWNYPRLRIAPCRYYGSVYTDNMVISAHNYASHFGNLSKLYEGASVRFTDIDGNVFEYRVGAKETLYPRDVEYMTDSGWDLTLFTCTPGGSYRVTVRCDRVNV